ncbi:MAG TPA: 23S rRNA (pseudouridine(1915)-N(3))-methyltransferase RlmH [Pyrinomonadaceae bacterium]|nr:23S rRNA (pseudouridine(1915)-N(3))-methyltransferase RlmH [Pyrinomonadaceae bacterium]
MKFRFIWVGKTRNKNYLALQDEYLQRLSHFVKCETVEIRDSAPHEGKEIEGKRILEKLNQTPFVCLLDVTGRGLSSPELAKEIEKWQNAGTKEISFVIGGADGIAPEVAASASVVLSLSFLTFTHEMARVVMLEQLYRAFTIIKGFPYQK